MGWVEDLHGKIVGLDTAPLIFYIEEHSVYAPLLDPFFAAVRDGTISVVTSTVTLIEVLVHPLKNRDEALASKYHNVLLSSPNFDTLPLTPSVAQAAAEMRAESQLKTPDAIQLATALTHNAAAFLTNDRDFGGYRGITILKLSALLTS